MTEKVPEPPEELSEYEPPERAEALRELHALNEELAKWARADDTRSRATLLHGAIAKNVDTDSVKKLSNWLRYFLDNEGARRDFENSLFD